MIWAVIVSLHWVGSLDLKQRGSSAASETTILLAVDTQPETYQEISPHRHNTHTHVDWSELDPKGQPVVINFSHYMKEVTVSKTE